MIAKFRVDNLRHSLQALKEVWAAKTGNKDAALDEIIDDSCVLRYNCALETAWKLMRKYLKLNYGKKDEELTIYNIFRLMNAYNMIDDWEKWKSYYEKSETKFLSYAGETQSERQSILDYVPRFIKDAQALLDKFDAVLENQ